MAEKYVDGQDSCFVSIDYLVYFRKRNSCHRILCHVSVCNHQNLIFWLGKTTRKFRLIFRLISQVPDKLQKKKHTHFESKVTK